jgi:hypothetical protein
MVGGGRRGFLSLRDPANGWPGDPRSIVRRVACLSRNAGPNMARDFPMAIAGVSHRARAVWELGPERDGSQRAR